MIELMKGFAFVSRDQIAVIALVGSLLVAGIASADRHDEDDEEEVPFAEGQVLIQLNDTDGDLGFHARIDGDAWTRLTIEGPNERRLLGISLRGALRHQGLTELAFESAEPTFDELDPEAFFERFPQGEYEIEGRGSDGTELESTSVLSHLIPAAPDDLSVSGIPAPKDCNGALPIPTEPIEIAWGPVTMAHAVLGRDGDVEVDSYEVAVEGESVDITINVDGETTSVELAEGAIPSGEEVKFQVLVREAEGNESSSESCFIAP